jgi:hypothetical protein
MQKKTMLLATAPLLVLSFAITIATTVESRAALLCQRALTQTTANSSRSLVDQDNVDDIKILSDKEKTTVVRSLLLSLQNYYGPKELKTKTIGFNWQKETQRLYRDLKEIKTDQEMVFRLTTFLRSLNDAHVSAELPSTLRWRIPMQVSYTPATKDRQARYTLNYIEREKAQTLVRGGELPPLEAELVSVDGIPVAEFQKNSPYFNSSGNELTNRGLFGTQIFRMSEKSGIPLSMMTKNVRRFEFQWQAADGTLVRKSVDLQYEVSGQGLINLATVLPAAEPSLADLLLKLKPKPAPAPAPEPTQAQGVGRLYSKIDALFSTRSRFEAEGSASGSSSATKAQAAEGYKIEIGQRLPVFHSQLPKDFTEIAIPKSMEGIFKSEHIFAGTFMRNGKRVGLLRIPTYGVNNVELAGPVIQHFVRQLEMKSDYLILDQMNNPGGSVTYSDMWIKALVGKINPSKHMQFRVRPTDHFMQNFAEIYTEMNTLTKVLPAEVRNPLLNEVREQFERVHLAYRAGESLSQPISLLPFLRSIELVQTLAKGLNPQKDLFADQPTHDLKRSAVYTKPILMLINHFDFSGGDATPASLADHGRVVLLGTRTAGAGGTVERFSLRLLATEFIYHLTTSLMYRPALPEQPYVENYGVKEHIKLEPTPRDYATGFGGYWERVLLIGDQITTQPPR